jgi:hypothetical protein
MRYHLVISLLITRLLERLYLLKSENSLKTGTQQRIFSL